MLSPRQFIAPAALTTTVAAVALGGALAQSPHPRLLADATDLAKARNWLNDHAWYRDLIAQHRAEIDGFLAHRPIYVSPVKQVYQYKMYVCPKHDVELLYEEFRPHEHRCPADTNETHLGEKYDSAWSGWYNRRLASHLVWMGILYQLDGEEKYAEAAREILLKFAELYLQYPTANTILGPAHVFFGTLSESFWGVDMAYGYDLVYNYEGFSVEEREILKDKLFYPLAKITQQFPESASNRQLWYNNVSAAVGFLYDDQELIDFAFNGKYGFEWQLGSALPASGFWAEWSGYHFVALRGMIHLAEMARHNGMDLYNREIAGRSMKLMFDAPFAVVKPNFEFPRMKDSGGGNLLDYAPFYEVGYAVYGDSRFLALLNRTGVARGTQVVGEDSSRMQQRAPVTLFNLEPELPALRAEIYPQQSSHLIGNGFAALRHGEGDERRYLYLDYGIMGGEHGHPDRLQIGYFALGRNWIVDPLNELYSNPNLQLWYRQTIAHNTVVLDQTSQTWSNGYEIFFGALPSLQIAAGESKTIYPGATLTRTVLQVGDYFIDLFEVASPEVRVIDWPLHSYGSLEIRGLMLEAQSPERFGPEPRYPGYDQLEEVYAGTTDEAWQGVFTTEDGKHLAVHAIGERSTEVLKAITPPLGGAYKQMVADPKPMPMLFSRRTTNATRFAHLIHAYDQISAVTAFSPGEKQNEFRIACNEWEDLLHADLKHANFWLVRRAHDNPILAAGFNVKEIKSGERTLLTANFVLPEIEGRWQEQTLHITTVPNFGQLRLWGPNVNKVEINGRAHSFRREGEYLIVRQSTGIVLEQISPVDSMLFLGRENSVTFRLWNFFEQPVTGKLSITLPANCNEQVRSQLDWWGGVVNLKAANKGPVQRKTWPSTTREELDWIDGLSSETLHLSAGASQTCTLVVRVPNDAAAVSYPASVNFAEATMPTRFHVTEPVVTDMRLPNAQTASLQLTFTNQTRERIALSARLMPHPAWLSKQGLQHELALAPLEKKYLLIPLELSGYDAKNQLYPVNVRVASGDFQMEVTRDFYVATAHFAPARPSTSGGWDNWNKSHPITIDGANQVCRLLLGNQPWRGPEDLSAKVYLMYDQEFLYVGAEVTDDVVVSHFDFPAMSYPWDTDCMEIVLDTRTNSAQGYDPPTPGLYRHLSLAEYRLTELTAREWRGGGAGGPLLPKPLLVPGGETYFHRTEKGYDMICRLPLTSLPNVIAKPGYKIGFDVAISDNDGTTYRKNQHIWAGFNQNQSWWDLGTIGALIFGPQQ